MPKITARQASTAERRIQHAIAALDRDLNLSISTAGRQYGVPKTTLANRSRGRTKSRQEAHIHQQLLTLEEEIAVERWINRLDDIEIPPKVSL